MTVTRLAEIADYLLSTGIGDTPAAWAAEVREVIAARWPDATPAELTAAFEITLMETGTALLLTLQARVEAGALATHGRPADGR